MLKISVITVTYNSEKFLKNYFFSLLRQSGCEFEIVIVDSFSTDKTTEKIEKFREKFKKKLTIKLIKSEKNLGYTEGNNLGAQTAAFDYLFFLGPDTKLDDQCLRRLAEKTKKIGPGNFLLLPRQKHYETGEFLLDGVCTDIFQFPYKIFNAKMPEETKQPFYADGTAIFLTKKTFEKLGGFDENLFLFCDDIDLSWKAHLLKIPLLNAPEAIVYHYSGGSLKGGIKRGEKYVTSYMRRYLGERNTLANFLKNYQPLTLLWLLPVYLLINLVEMSVFTFFGRWKITYQYLAAWWWNVKKIKSILAKRKWIQERRKISDLEILKRLYFGSGKLKAFIHIRIPTFEEK